MKVSVGIDRAPGATSWTVAVSGRPDRVVARTPNGFPVPPETALLPPAFAAADGAQLAGCLARIQSGNPRAPDAAAGTAGDMVDFGRYLLAVAFGDGWPAILQANADPGVELTLVWGADDAELARLPWEMMCSGNSFLAASTTPSVSILRRVPVTGAEPLGARGPAELKVLFVVGNDLSDPVIRAGAEYLGLLRRLRSQWMSLPHRLVLAATKEDVLEVAGQYGPTVVHLTCHGEWNSIHLCPGPNAPANERAQGYSPLSAEGLLKLLPATPHIVVVNACDSASGRPPQPGAASRASFAAELAELGVPVVVGMGGKVADHASRLFSLRFYQALLEAGQDGTVSPADAAAEGRRAALRMGATPQSSDWIHSRVLVRSDADAVVKISGLQLAQQLEKIACTFRTRGPLCDRFDAFREFERWLDGNPARMLFVLQGPDVTDPPVQYGCSHLLQELAGHAVSSAYLPVLVDVPDLDKVAPSPDNIIQRIALAIERARTRAGLPEATLVLTELRQLLLNPAQAPESAVLKKRLALVNREDPEALSAALGADLSALAADAKTAGLRPLLMLDDVHKWDPALRTLVQVLMQGISFPAEAVPVALCCRKWPAKPSVDGPVQQLLENTESTHTVKVEKFGAEQEGLAYRQYAILRTPPLVANPANADVATTMLESALQRYVQGIPSLFRVREVNVTLEVLTLTKTLVSADDDSILQTLQGK